MYVDTINCSVTLIYNVIRSRCSIETMGKQKHDSIEKVLVVFLLNTRIHLHVYFKPIFFQLIWPNDRHRSHFKDHVNDQTLLQHFFIQTDL